MPVAAFMQAALYDPSRGYYAAGARRTGWRGHFLTSAELGPAFGLLWARSLEAVWRECGSPTRFDVVEVGPGEGGFTAALLDGAGAAFSEALRVTLVERTAAVAERQRDRLGDHPNVAWIPSIVDLVPIEHGCVVANEVLDNLPVHLVEARAGSVLEVCVEEGDGGLVERLRPPSSPELVAFLERHGVQLPDGHRFEIGLAAESFVKRIAAALHTGAVIFIDYGHEAADLVELPRGTLACYSEMGVDDEYLSGVGSKDITSHANWTAVRSSLTVAGMDALGPLPQRDVLRALGAAELDRHLKDSYGAALAEGRGKDAVAALSRRQSLSALLDPAGLGGLQVMVGARGIDVDRVVAGRE